MQQCGCWVSHGNQVARYGTTVSGLKEVAETIGKGSISEWPTAALFRRDICESIL
jgi:hypothetical protein